MIYSLSILFVLFTTQPSLNLCRVQRYKTYHNKHSIGKTRFQPGLAYIGPYNGFLPFLRRAVAPEKDGISQREKEVILESLNEGAEKNLETTKQGNRNLF